MELAPPEVQIAAIARLIAGAGHVAVGAASPIPAAAALLERVRSGGRTRVSILHRRRGNPFTEGSRELFDLAGQGRIDVFFLGGAQIDGEANINLVGIGGYPVPKVRFPGSFGSAFMYFSVPRVILYREEHSTRVLVERVDFVSAPGVSAENVHRPGGPVALVTGRCVFVFERVRRRFRLASLHPGHTVDEVIANTGFAFDRPERVPETETLSGEALDLLRGPVAAELAETYPEFARRAFGAGVG
ncbi:MAG: CoA synthetase [Proteobacteria bacterium]|nr:CoA synthetase [Pseudomonadota bacterium]